MCVNDAVGFYVSRRNNDQILTDKCQPPIEGVSFLTISRRGRFCSFILTEGLPVSFRLG